MSGCNKDHKSMIPRGTKWQAPGKGRLFDSTFDVPLKIVDIKKAKTNNIISTPLTITTLHFIKECNDKCVACTNKYIEDNLLNYFEQNIENYKPNKANIMHNVKNPLFYGLIEEIPVDSKTNKYVLTIDGRKFLDSIDSKKYIDAVNWFIVNLLNVKYPGNKAVKRTKTPNLYPFRVLFFLLNKYQILSKNDLETWVPYICFKEDLNKDTYIKAKEPYAKWNSWVMSTLWKLNILKKTKGAFEIDNSVYPISKMIKATHLVDDEFMLFCEKNGSSNKHSSISRKYFTNKIKTAVKEMYDWKCWIDPSHIVPIAGKSKKPNLEVHHIIPCEFENSFPELLDFNCYENLVPICHNCHVIIHNGSDLLQRKKIVDMIWYKKQKFLSKYITSKDELLALYTKL